MCIITLKSITEKILRIVSCENEVRGVEWNRLVDLNRLLKGFRPGELTVVSGKTGTGKTTFISEYSLDLAESGVKTLWGSFEISVPKLCKTLLTQFARKNFTKHPESIEEYIDKFHKNIPIYFIRTTKQLGFRELFEQMQKGVKEYGIQHIILDNLQFIVGNSGNSIIDTLHVQDKFVGDLRRFVNESNTHITLIAHPRKENTSEILTINSLYGGCKLSQEADNVLLLQTLESKNNKKYIQVVKNRHDGTLGIMNLVFKFDILSYSVPKVKAPSMSNQSGLVKKMMY